jgi:hypothetical protein
MKYIALDIVTTGPSPERHQILQIVAIADNLEKPGVPVQNLPRFDSTLDPIDIVGDPFALAENEHILRTIASKRGYITDGDPDTVLQKFSEWVRATRTSNSTDPVVVVGTDIHQKSLPFLSHHSRKLHALNWYVPVDVRLFSLEKGDKTLPEMQSCLIRSLGNSDTYVKQDALNNACNIVRLMRAHFETEAE